MCAQSLSCVLFFGSPWTIIHQAPLSTGFFMQEYCIGLPFPPPHDPPNPGNEPMYPASLALESGFSTTEPPRNC